MIPEHAHQPGRATAYGALSSPDSMLRLVPSSTTRQGVTLPGIPSIRGDPVGGPALPLRGKGDKASSGGARTHLAPESAMRSSTRVPVLTSGGPTPRGFVDDTRLRPSSCSVSTSMAVESSVRERFGDAHGDRTSLRSPSRYVVISWGMPLLHPLEWTPTPTGNHPRPGGQAERRLGRATTLE